MEQTARGTPLKNLAIPTPSHDLQSASRLEWMEINDTYVNDELSYYAMVMTGVSPNILLVNKKTGYVLCIPSQLRQKDRYKFVRYLTVDEGVTIFGSAPAMEEATAQVGGEEIEDEDVLSPPSNPYDMESIPDLVGFYVMRDGIENFVAKNGGYLYIMIGTQRVDKQPMNTRKRVWWGFTRYATEMECSGSNAKRVMTAARQKTTVYA